MYEAEKDSVASAMYEARKMSLELQREKEATFGVVQEARQKHKDLQEYLERESSRLSTALMIVQKERDAASQAASEATSSAKKAREVLSDVLCAYDTEMANVRRLSSQLQVPYLLSYIREPMVFLVLYLYRYVSMFAMSAMFLFDVSMFLCFYACLPYYATMLLCFYACHVSMFLRFNVCHASMLPCFDASMLAMFLGFSVSLFLGLTRVKLVSI